MDSPAWTVVREVSMENYEKVVRYVRRTVTVVAFGIFVIVMVIYLVWLKRRMPQFDSLLDGIIRIGQGDLETREFVPTSIIEFQRMQQEINKTSQALRQQMDTIRQMEREQMELENQKRAQELIVRELSTARQIQESMLPHIFPPYPDRSEVNLFASMDPARDVGGDFYDFFFIDEDHLCLVIADVSGKGIPGAMFMMISKRIIEDSARQVHSPAEILYQTNEALCDSNQMDMFVTAWLGILEISTGKLTAANAGHEFPAIRRKNGSFELYKDKHSFVLGGMEGVPYKEYDLHIAPGDKLFVYTDGVPEATNAASEMFGEERLMRILNENRQAGPTELIQRVHEALDAFADGAPQFDDTTMLCLKYTGE
jgi:sigma-B regulation protein RsbU (phosphoserine phosphatase)